MSNLIKGIYESITLLRKYDAVPTRVEVTQEQFDRLKRELDETGILVSDSPSMQHFIYGVEIIVKDMK